MSSNELLHEPSRILAGAKPGWRAWLRRHWPVVALTALALAVRLAGSRSNLPYLYSPGESIVVRQALAYGAGTLKPYTFVYPPLYSYLLFACYGAYYVLGHLAGAFPTVAEFATSYFVDPTPFYWMGRILTALLGSATVPLTYAIAARAYGRKPALAAAALLAVSHLHVTHSHYVLTDVPMTFLVALAAYLVQRAAARDGLRPWLIAGLAVGVGVAMKYLAALGGLVVLVGALGWARGRSWRRALAALGIAAGGALAGFIVACPYAVLDFSALWDDLVGVQLGLNTGIAAPFGETLRFYGQTLFKTALGPPAAVAALGGLLYLTWRRRWADGLVLAFPVGYLLFLGFQGRYQPNWLLPALPFLCIAAGALLMALAQRWAGPRYRATLWSIALLALLAYPAWYSYFHVVSIRQKDTRTLAKAWVEAHIPAGTKILLDSSTTGPPLLQTLESFTRYFDQAAVDKAMDERDPVAQQAFGSYRQYQLEAARRLAGRSAAYDLEYMTLAWWRAEEGAADMAEIPVFGVYRERIFTLDQLRQAGFQYVIVSSFQYVKYVSEEGRTLWPSYYAFYRSLDEQARLVQSFAADPIHQPGPDIKVYALQGAP